MFYQQARQPFWHRHPILTAGAVLGAVWMLQNGWYLTVAVSAALVVYLGLRTKQRNAARIRAGLRARADIENRMALAGDPRGIHGRYPPVRAGWFPDPRDRSRLRYFDGAAWSRHTVDR